MNNIADEILKAVKYAIDRQKIKCDRTYKTIIKEVTYKGYVVLDRTGSERTVKCCIPGIKLKARQFVWVKEPLGEIQNLHIVGVIEK
ncbi:MAG: hypothetical protein K2N95_02900 [Lachnospiraceae bacterium]|nr:hypothetical protein [Lachnospiraceae bacterium]